MLFRKKIDRCCQYCQHAAVIDEENVLCSKRGMASLYDACRKFRYDPTKRIPPRPKAVDFKKYDEEDFSL